MNKLTDSTAPLMINHARATGFEAAIRGMRYPYNSISDSDVSPDGSEVAIGPRDRVLMYKLVTRGGDHAKFMRLISVTMDITAPRFWWPEMDQYKVGTVKCSESTMHTIMKKPFIFEDFALDYESFTGAQKRQKINDFSLTVAKLNKLRIEYNSALTVERSGRKPDLKSTDVWRCLIERLPQSYKQTATWGGNYQVLRAIYHARKGHKLKEWQIFRDAIKESLPMSELITDTRTELLNRINEMEN